MENKNNKLIYIYIIYIYDNDNDNANQSGKSPGVCEPDAMVASNNCNIISKINTSFYF